MEWKCSEFKHLSTHELYSILRARSAVFVVEYAHIHLDITDDKDQGALHDTSDSNRTADRRRSSPMHACCPATSRTPRLSSTSCSTGLDNGVTTIHATCL